MWETKGSQDSWRIAHFGNTDLPWQRVVKKDGSLASGYPGGVNGHKRVLESEGVTFHQMKIVNMQELLWRPKI